ncbi:M14 family metallopeptidase [uncultured Draconibacterium sp.]|uniref:M14 family metallopeptidase n=1 Tax=uncultured Draconibacterium sp. TaxID=1573823 RepID=UPI0029C92A64|nr:M14 family metallopeptidase [uncultured Draconibacterium sp.]
MKYYLIFAASVIFFLSSCQPKDTKWEGQEPIKKVSTLTRPIQYQLKKTYDVGNGIFLSNEFDGARLNGVALTGENEVAILITPENTPINESPWYAFKIWSETEKAIQLKITYNEGVGHRYYPKISNDRKNWTPVDSTVYLADTASVARGESPKFCEFTLAINRDTTWVAAQELIVSKDIYSWAGELSEKPFVSFDELGKSKEGRPINYLQIGNPESKKMLMVLSRQHPPEVTGWLAMKAFTEKLCAPDELSEKFRKEYCIYVVPCVNPDGVDNGHWRHNAGGIDLNRDWEDFNQPETRAVRKFMQAKVAEQRKFYFIIDFHSTYEDIYYTIAPELNGNMPGIVPKIIQAMAEDIPGYDPNIRPNAADVERINSTVSVFHEFGAEAVTYEVGDGTPRELIREKGKLTAVNLMEIMLEN